MRRTQKSHCENKIREEEKKEETMQMSRKKKEKITAILHLKGDSKIQGMFHICQIYVIIVQI